MKVAELINKENVALVANVCTVLLFLIVVIRHAITFARKLNAPWQAWLALLLQIFIGILLVFFAKPSWVGLIVVWGMIAINELNRRVSNGIVDRYRESLDECRDMVDRSLDLLEKATDAKEQSQ